MKNIFFLILFLLSSTLKLGATTINEFYSDVNSHTIISSKNTINSNISTVLIPLNEAKPGQNVKYQLFFKNEGILKSNGQIVLKFDSSKMSFLSTDCLTFRQENNKLIFDYDRLNNQESRIFNIRFTLFNYPLVQNNDTLLFNVIGYSSIDSSKSKQSFSLFQQHVKSFVEPNSKRILEGDEIPIENSDQFIHFIIHFQNKGTTNANTIIINDLLEDKLDASTFELVSTSHTVSVEKSGSSIDFIFNNINLPIEQEDAEGSKGFVVFKVKPKEGIVVGDIIRNRASIKFDTKPPILTNIVEVEFVENLSVSGFEKHGVKVYPNPTQETLFVESISEISSIEISSVLGQKLLTIQPTQNFEKISLSSLVAGHYFIKIQIGGQSKVYHIIKQ